MSQMNVNGVMKFPSFLVAALAATMASTTNAQDATAFNMWPNMDPGTLASTLGFTETCLNALNTTVQCDPDLFRMAGQVDNYFWSSDNITDLCTDTCQGSASDWLGGVWNNCSATDSIVISSLMVSVDTVAQRYISGINLACLTDTLLTIVPTSNITNATNGTTSTITSSTSTSTVSMSTSTSSSNSSSQPIQQPNSTVTVEYNNATFNYCFLQAQNWTGVVPPDCSDPSTGCVDANAGNRIANLYNDTILCSPCFISVLWHRINSPFLPNTDYSDFLIDQYQDIQDVCNFTVTSPVVAIRPVPSYPAAPVPTYLPPDTDPNENYTAPTGCAGQTISVNGQSCDSLSAQYGVTTGDLESAANSTDCSTASSLCLPLSCNVTQLTTTNSCPNIAESLSTSSFNVTMSLFLGWNPNIQGLCDNITVPQYICTSAPGGGYVLPPPINGTNATAAGQQRGGQSGGGNPDGPLPINGPTPNSTESAPTRDGIAANCNMFIYVNRNDTCYDLAQEYNITLAQFTTWNPVLGYPDGHNCTTQLWAGYDYCVGVNGTNSTTTTTTSTMMTTSTATTTLAYPTQSGIVSNCNTYAEAVSGDYCYEFAQKNNITTDQLYAWNQILGPNGQNCSNEFFAGYDYCVGVSGGTTTTTSTVPMTTTTSTSTTTTSAVPTQSGIVSNCDDIVEAQSGDYCYQFAMENNITTAELYQWNTILGPNGQNCTNEFFAGYGYCVGVSN